MVSLNETCKKLNNSPVFFAAPFPADSVAQ